MTKFEFKDEQLIGFLIGALDEHENQLIAKRLLLDPDLADRLVDLQLDVAAFDAAQDLFAPDSIEGHIRDADALTCSLPSGPCFYDESDSSIEAVCSSDDLSKIKCWEDSQSENFGDLTAAENSARPKSKPSLIDRTFELINSSKKGSWLSGGMSEVDARDRESTPGRGSWFDLLAISAVLFIAFSLLVPSIYYSRDASRQIRCADNLRSLGVAFGQYSIKNNDNSLPGFSGDDPMAFAGRYAIELNDAGLLEGRSQLNCTNYRIEYAFEKLPRIEQYLDMCEGRQQYWQRAAGGTYAFNAGYNSGKGFQPVRMQGRSHIAILSDLPIQLTTFEMEPVCGVTESQPIEHSIDVSPWNVHGNGGLNILFEDGSVRYINAQSNPVMLKELFFNQEGRQDVGLNEEDCVLLPSHYRPTIFQPRCNE